MGFNPSGWFIFAENWQSWRLRTSKCLCRWTSSRNKKKASGSSWRNTSKEKTFGFYFDQLVLGFTFVYKWVWFPLVFDLGHLWVPISQPGTSHKASLHFHAWCTDFLLTALQWRSAFSLSRSNLLRLQNKRLCKKNSILLAFPTHSYLLLESGNVVAVLCANSCKCTQHWSLSFK